MFLSVEGPGTHTGPSGPATGRWLLRREFPPAKVGIRGCPLRRTRRRPGRQAPTVRRTGSTHASLARPSEAQQVRGRQVPGQQRQHCVSWCQRLRVVGKNEECASGGGEEFTFAVAEAAPAEIQPRTSFHHCPLCTKSALPKRDGPKMLHRQVEGGAA